MATRNKPITIGGLTVEPGQRAIVDIPLASMYTHSDVQITIHVVNGKRPGPRLFVCAALHGDELNGVEIIRRLMLSKQLNQLRGTLIAIPVVNVHGFLSQSRYLPDGRDLNRSFPGSTRGSLASRVAFTFYNEIVSHCTHGIDLHTGARHRTNLPQIRADLSDTETQHLAEQFGVPVVIDSALRDGSLREAAAANGIPLLLYEAGEALRFDEIAIRAGVQGVLNVMRALEMLPPRRRTSDKKPRKVMFPKETQWVRAPESGIVKLHVDIGAHVTEDQSLATVTDPLGLAEYVVRAPREGIVIGLSRLPLTHEGEALFHLAHYTRHTERIADHLLTFHDSLLPQPHEEALPVPKTPQD